VRRAVVICTLLLATAAPAEGSIDQESILQDDPLIVYPSSDKELDRTFATLRALGVDRVRVSLFWNLVAPRPRSERRPSFGSRGAAWPSSYPRGAWRRYDDIVRLAERYEVGVLFTLTGPAPNWAARRKGGEYSVYKPKPSEFRAFATAAGRRYSGWWSSDSGSIDSPARLPAIPLARARPAQNDEERTLPRVSHWSIWNEANFPSWLSPQSRPTRLRGYRGKLLPYSPHHYRKLVDAAWEGLQDSGHGSDLVLIGETAPRGGRIGVNRTIAPVKFLRELYCLDAGYAPFRGRQARARRCPDTEFERATFVADHPGLFHASGWAHHPYSLDNRPNWRHPSPNSVPLGSMELLIGAWDSARLAWGNLGQGDIWITEYGYQTPPDPYIGIPLVRQALWTTWAEYIAYGNPRIASMAQFLLNDDAPDTKFDVEDSRRWRTWQSGLATHSGKRKPAFEEYPFPIHVTPTAAEEGQTVQVFGIARPLVDGAPLIARIRIERNDGQVETLTSQSVTNAKGYLDAVVDPGGPGDLHILWVDPASGGSATTRAVPITGG
jgi:hypothetical protein